MKKESTSTNDKQTSILDGEFWLNSNSEVRRHTLLNENPSPKVGPKAEKKEEAQTATVTNTRQSS